MASGNKNQLSKIRRVYSILNTEVEKKFLAEIFRIYNRNMRRYDNKIVSVIMPTFNRRGMIIHAIESVLQQTHKNFELIIVDDGSTDNTYETIKKYDLDNRIRFERIAHSGVSAARNIGLDMAQGEIIFFLDSDNLWVPHFLKTMIVYMLHGRLEASYSGIKILADDNNMHIYRGDEFFWEECLKQNYVDMNSFCHNRCLKQSIKFDESINRLVDWDYILRITSFSRTAYAPFIGVNYYNGKKFDRISNNNMKCSDFTELVKSIWKKNHYINPELRNFIGLRPRWQSLLIRNNNDDYMIGAQHSITKSMEKALKTKKILSTNKNKKIKFLHVMTIDKFLSPFIDFVDKQFGRDGHYYVFVEAERYDYGLTPEHDVEFLSTIDEIFITLKDYMHEAEKIIIHGLWRNEICILLFYNQDLLKKCYWVMWGGDFYFPKNYPLIKKNVIKNMGHIINYTIGDYQLVRKYYGTNAEHHKCFGYLSNTYQDYSYLKTKLKNNNNKKIILIGNSADPANSHMEIFKKILEYKDANIEIICPLSYGNEAYAKQVIQEGITIFGRKFKPLTKFIPLEEYIKILWEVDIAIFAHKRQQAMGNIRLLLGLGKKVYIRDDITSWQSLRDIEVKVYSFNSEKIDFDFPISFQNDNTQKIKENFSYTRLISDWKQIFDS